MCLYRSLSLSPEFANEEHVYQAFTNIPPGETGLPEHLALTPAGHNFKYIRVVFLYFFKEGEVFSKSMQPSHSKSIMMSRWYKYGKQFYQSTITINWQMLNADCRTMRGLTRTAALSRNNWKQIKLYHNWSKQH